jgi:hypothetical protein
LVSDNLDQLSNTKVDRAVTNFIFGGTNVIAGIAQDFTQIGCIRIPEGDLVGLANGLKSLGIGQGHVEEATQALVEDGKPGEMTLGKKAREWIKTLGSKVGDAGLKIGTGAAHSWQLNGCFSIGDLSPEPPRMAGLVSKATTTRSWRRIGEWSAVQPPAFPQKISRANAVLVSVKAKPCGWPRRCGQP